MSTRRTTRVYTVPKLCRVFSFIAVLLMGLGIAVSIVLGQWVKVSGAYSVAAWIKHVAITLGMIALCWYSYYEARIHGTTWFVLWVISVVLVVLVQVLGFTPWFRWWL